MSYTFTLKGIGSELSARFFPPIQLEDYATYSMGSIDLETFNSIPNIEPGCDKFYYIIDDATGKTQSITIPAGSYDIRDIEKFLHDELGSPDKLKLRANANTLKSELKSKFKIDFSPPDSIARILGFSPPAKPGQFLEADKWHVSDKPVDILKVSVIRVECNIVTGSYINGEDAHIVHEFFPNVPPGVKIIEVPSNVIYLPINTKSIDSLFVRLLDQNGQLINFRDEVVTLRLHLRKDGFGFRK